MPGKTQTRNAALAEVESAMQQLATGSAFSLEQQKLPRLGIRVPQQRARLKQGYQFQQDRSVAEITDLWHYVYRFANHYETRHQAIYAFQHKSLSKGEFDTVRKWIDHCDCWEQSDDLSKIYAEVFEHNPDWFMPVYQQWNQHSNPWKRRGSIVGLLEYAQKRQRVQPFSVLIDFVIPLIDDDDYYVQKAVGWTLREIYNLYPDQTWQFLKLHAGQIPPEGYYAATEKLNKTDKAEINLLRKLARQKQP